MEAKELEKVLLDMFAEFKKAIPNIHRISLVCDEDFKGNRCINGFYHIGVGCERFETIEELYSILHDRREKKEEAAEIEKIQARVDELFKVDVVLPFGDVALMTYDEYMDRLNDATGKYVEKQLQQ